MFDHLQKRLLIIVWRWFSFLFCSVLLSAFAFGVIPWVSFKMAPEFTRVVHDSGIEASALFYSESETAGEAFNYFENNYFCSQNASIFFQNRFLP